MSAEKGSYICESCKISFSTKSSLKRHLDYNCINKVNLKIECCNLPMEKDNTIHCEFCKKTFSKKYNLDRHLLSNRGDCYKIRSKLKYGSKTILNDNTINNNTYIGKQVNNYNNYNTTINNIVNNINVQPIIKPQIILANHGEETISHITKDIMLEILNIESFPKMCTELMRVLYFNKQVPENQNWAIVYPKNKNAGIEFNHTTGKFERKSTCNIIDDKFSNMISLLFDLVQEISKEDDLEHNLSQRQKININKYGMHFGQLDISKTSKEVYKSIHEFAFNSRKQQMEVWKENGHEGNHLSLKF
jgi:Zinc finger, C2H2 type